MFSFRRQKCGPRPKLFFRLDIFSTFRGVHIDFSICAFYCYWLSTWGTSEFLKGKAKSCFRDWPFVYFSGGFISHLFGDFANTHTHTHTQKKDIFCLMTSARPTSSPHKFFSYSHHDERTSFLITNLPKHEREFIPKVSKVRINRIQLHLYSRSPRNR